MKVTLEVNVHDDISKEHLQKHMEKLVQLTFKNISDLKVTVE